MKLLPALSFCLAASSLGAASLAHSAVKVAPWGTKQAGQKVELYTLNDPQLTVEITNFGAHVVSIEAPARNGHRADVVLGFKSLDGYEADSKTYMGSVVGRYGNRIANAKFSLDGKTYTFPPTITATLSTAARQALTARSGSAARSLMASS